MAVKVIVGRERLRDIFSSLFAYSVCLSSTVSGYIAGNMRNGAVIMRLNPILTAGWTWFPVVSVLYNYETSTFFLTFPDLILNCYQ